jgi:hypothetical protein
MSTTKSCRVLVCLVWALVCAGCTAQVGGVVEEDLEATEFGDPEEESEYSTFTTYNFAIGAQVEVCKTSVGLNNRSGPGSSYMVLRVLSNGTRAFVLAKSGNWFNLDLAGGEQGWSYGKYLCLVEDGTPAPSPAPSPEPDPSDPSGFDLSRDGIINICKAFVGFSYWWGGAAFPNPWDNPQSASKGKCYSATSSGHSGSYGADCSGYAGKVWKIPSALPFPSNKHPYSTYNYYYDKNYWSHIARSDTLRADGLVYRSSSGGGHIVIYEKGDPWGSAWTYEARGCSWGVVHNLRNISSSYRARRRDGV